METFEDVTAENSFLSEKSGMRHARAGCQIELDGRVYNPGEYLPGSNQKYDSLISGRESAAKAKSRGCGL